MSTTLVTTPAKTTGPSIPSTSQPATPTSGTYQPSPGRFRHPRLTEIIERRSRVSLTGRDVQNASINAGALLLTFVLGDLLQTISASFLSISPALVETIDAGLIITLLRIFLLVNIVYCLRPVIPYIARTDNVNDIPLTPSQRQLLGLPPSASTVADAASYITPPRYRRNSGTGTSMSTPSTQASTADRRSISANYSSSPLSTSRWNLGFSSPAQPQQHNTPGTSRSYRRASGSPFASSPVGSPLFYKAVTNTGANNASDLDISRSSFNTSTASGFGLSRSQSMRERIGGDLDGSIGPGTPSPTARKVGAGGGINYKWLYDKGGRLPKRDSIGF